MGLVMQEPTLFNYTIMENILYGKMDASNDEIRQSSQIANALDFIESSQIENAIDDGAETLYNEMKRHE